MALRELAKLWVRITARRDELKKDLEGAKQDVKQFSDDAKKSAGGVGDAFGGVGEKIKESTKGVRGFVSAITGVIGVVTRVLGIIGLIAAAITGIIALLSKVHEWLTRTESQTKEFRDRMRETSEASAKIINDLNEVKTDPAVQQLKRIGEEIATLTADAEPLRAELERLEGGPNLNRRYGAVRSDLLKLQDQIKAKEAEAAEIRNASSEKLARDEKKRQEAQEQANRNYEAFHTKMTMDRIEGEVDAVEAGLDASLEANKIKAQSDREFAAINTKMTMARIESEVDAIEEMHNKRLSLIEAEEAHRLRIQIENLNRLNAIQQSINQANSGITFDVRRLERNVDNIRRRLTY